MTDLWPDDMFHPSGTKSPANILREQASILGKKTNNLLKGDVVRIDLEETVTKKNFDFGYYFYILVPTLNNYRYKLFAIYHYIDLYPVSIEIDQDFRTEIDSDEQIIEQNRSKRWVTGPRYLVSESEEDFTAILSKIFGSQKTRKIIGSLIEMVNPSKS